MVSPECPANLQRPYRTWGYPWVPILFILINLGIAAATLVEKPLDALRGVVIVSLGVPAYLFWKKRVDPTENGRDSAATQAPQ